MSYPSIDHLQKTLAREIFGDRKEAKKASGRALGTLLELTSYYILQEWGLTNNVIIELRLPEYGNPSITHNVEFALHPLVSQPIPVTGLLSKKPLTAKKLRNSVISSPTLFESSGLSILQSLAENYTFKDVTILGSDNVQRNNAIIGSLDSKTLLINFFKEDVFLCEISDTPFSMIECKRVGVEDGNKKGPTTIEKAKQGAYVAKAVSALQKVRARNGELLGFYENSDGIFSHNNYIDELRRLVYETPPKEMYGFLLTVGIVSNHGNWYSEEELNKELLVLKDSYDWLLFLKDESMVEFVMDTIIKPKETIYEAIRVAFHDSYDKEVKGNKFTKVKIDRDAHLAMSHYFSTNIKHIEQEWFNVITPGSQHTADLKNILVHLANKMNQC